MCTSHSLLRPLNCCFHAILVYTVLELGLPEGLWLQWTAEPPSRTKGSTCFQRLASQLPTPGWPHMVDSAPSSLFGSSFRTLPARHLFLRDSSFISGMFSLETSSAVGCAWTACLSKATEDWALDSQPSATKPNGGIRLVNHIMEAPSSTNNPPHFASPTKARQANHFSIPLCCISPEDEHWGHMQLCVF